MKDDRTPYEKAMSARIVWGRPGSGDAANGGARRSQADRPTEPEGFQPAWLRFRRDWNTFRHSIPNIFVEGVRSLGVRDPLAKWTGKAILALALAVISTLLAGGIALAIVSGVGWPTGPVVAGLFAIIFTALVLT